MNKKIGKIEDVIVDNCSANKGLEAKLK